MTAPLLEMTGVVKAYPGAVALNNVSLSLASGEILAVVGENGAGKSTLIKVLAGAVAPDAGTVMIQGEPLTGGDPAEAIRRGVSVIYQEFNLVPDLSAAANVFLGREPNRLGWLNRNVARKRAAKLFEQLGVAVDPNTNVRDLTIAQQQAVEIAKALAGDAKILVLDEPTAALTPLEAERLFAVVRSLAAQGVGVIYISHRLEEVFALANRVMVLRDGEHVTTKPVTDVTRTELIELMVGRKLDREFPPSESVPGEPRFAVKNLSRGKHVQNISFEIRRGEVLGLTGLVGSGRTEVLRLLFGADRADSGTLTLDNRNLSINSPRDAIRAGIALLTEDRKGQGLILNHSVRENYALPNLGLWSRLGILGRRLENIAFRSAGERVRLKAPNANAAVNTLSGGNQQKVVLAKWLERNCDVILFDEPTRGIDVGAKYEIYLLIRALAAQGKAILLVSSEMPEVLGLADRILVMHAGRIAGEVADARTANQPQLLQLAMG